MKTCITLSTSKKPSNITFDKILIAVNNSQNQAVLGTKKVAVIPTPKRCL